MIQEAPLILNRIINLNELTRILENKFQLGYFYKDAKERNSIVLKAIIGSAVNEFIFLFIEKPFCELYIVSNFYLAIDNINEYIECVSNFIEMLINRFKLLHKNA